MKKQAFTLAEVLPTLITDFQKHSTATMVKALYSKIN